MQFGTGVLRVKNHEPNPTVFSKSVNGDPVKISFAANGQHGDTQRVPLALADDVDFLNSLESGCLEVIDGPGEVVEALRFETASAREQRNAEAAKAASAVVDRRQDRDIIGVTCIGPLPAGRTGLCGQPLLISSAQQADTPPLCSRHAMLAPEFSLVETGSKGEGATDRTAGVVRREWRRAVIDAPRQSN